MMMATAPSQINGKLTVQLKDDGVEIDGANQSTLALTKDQVGKIITVTASYTDGEGTAKTLTAAATEAVTNTGTSNQSSGNYTGRRHGVHQHQATGHPGHSEPHRHDHVITP